MHFQVKTSRILVTEKMLQGSSSWCKGKLGSLQQTRKKGVSPVQAVELHDNWQVPGLGIGPSCPNHSHTVS